MLEKITLSTSKRDEMVNITRFVQKCVDNSGVEEGMCMVYNPHTTAAITVNESSDPDVTADILIELDKIVPWRDGYRHFEGNSAAHIKSSMFHTSTQLMVHEGRLLLGQWQAIYFCEFDGPRSRTFYVKIMPDSDSGNRCVNGAEIQ